MKIIRDAVHGDMEFDEIERRVFDSPPMQRLRGIKQLGMASLVFPSAVHTRFEHSLGTAWMAKRILKMLPDVDQETRRTTVLASLVHDVTHIPFGHTFEDERRLFDRHDEDSERLDHFLSNTELSEALDSVGQRKAVRNVLIKSPDASPLALGIVSGAVSADLLDYLRRDALFCGLGLQYDERLFQLFAVADGRLVIKLHKGGTLRRDALSELIHLLQMRYALTERVYYHHAKCAAGAMICKALELAQDAGKLYPAVLYPWGDDVLLHLLNYVAPQVEGLDEIVLDFWSRKLFQRAYTTTLAGFGRPGLTPTERDVLAANYHDHVDPSGPSAERKIAERLGMPENRVIIYCPSPKMALKEADVPVETAPGVVRSLGDLGHPDVDALKQKHAGLWRFYVFIRRDSADRTQAGKVCEEIIGPPNLLAS